MAEAIAVLGLVGNIVQVVDFSWRLIAKSKEAYNSGSSALEGGPIIEAATADLKLLNSKLQEDASLTKDPEFFRLCQACNEVAEKLLKALRSISINTKQRLWTSVRKALKSVMTKDEIDELERRLASIRQELNLRISVDVRCVSAPSVMNLVILILQSGKK